MSMKSKLLLSMLPLMLGGMMNEPYSQRSSYEPKHDRLKLTTDKVIEALVSKGVCFIDKSLFYQLCSTLPQKLRGQVLFHCDIKSQKIFITYTKAAR